MRVSKAEQQRTHRRIIEAAIEVIASRGFREATMREIAERAQVGDATIYKYFPTKESLLFAFFELRMDALVERLQAIPNFHQYSFREQCHVLLETQLEIFAADRDFIRIAYNGVFLTNWIETATASNATKERFIAIVEELVTAAVEAGEFEEPPFRRVFYKLLWEYTIVVTWYWLKDDSRKYASTTQMIDKSLAVLDAILKSNILNKGVDLTQFLVREHLLSRINLTNQEHASDPPRPKRQFILGRTAPSQPAKKKRSKKPT